MAALLGKKYHSQYQTTLVVPSAMMRVITIKIDEDLLERIDLNAQKYGISRSELIRRAVIRYLSKLESELVAEDARSRVLRKKAGRR